MSMKMDKMGSEKDDFTCPICMYILIHPVTMPCTHSLCMPCYKQCVEKTNLSCPLCRIRISSWARKHSRSNTLVDEEKWELIQRTFPVKVKNRLEDREESSDDEWEAVHYLETELRKRKEVSKPGELRQEYEAALAQLRRQQEEEKKKEEEASAALIRALQDEEEEEIAELDRQRELNERKGIEAALQLDNEEKTTTLRSVSCNNAKSCGSNLKNKASNKPRRCENSSRKLDTFFESIRRTSSSAPLVSERAPTPSRPKMTLSVKEQKLSPYPYICISPGDKVQTNPSPSECSSPEGALEPHLSEHSYTTASARRVNLTSESKFYMSCRRSDVPVNQVFVKMEPLDLSTSPESEYDEPVSSFQPIESFVRTPPRHIPSGKAVMPCVVRLRAVPRNLHFNDLPPTVPPSRTVTETISKPCVDCPLDNDNPQPSRVQLSGNELHQISICGSGDQLTGTATLKHCEGSRNTEEQIGTGRVSVCTSTSSISNNTQLNEPECISNDKGAEDIVDLIDDDDDIITEDTPLLIPLEPDLSVCNIENECNPFLLCSQIHPKDGQGKQVAKIEQLGKNKLLGHNNHEEKPMLQETSKKINGCSDHNHCETTSSSSQLKPTSSKSKLASKSRSGLSASSASKSRKTFATSNMSIRQFCVPSDKCDDKSCNSRKRKASSDDIFPIDQSTMNGNICDNSMDQEEADRLFALQLQDMYCQLDKRCIKVDRHKGSKDEYLLRKRKRM